MRILLTDAFGILLSIFISISPLKSCFWQKAAVTNVFTKFIVIWKKGDRLSILVRSSLTKNRSLACVQTSPLPQKKSREESLPPIFLREEGRLYTGYRSWNCRAQTWQIIWTQFFEKGYMEIASTKSVILGNMVYGRSHQCWKQTEAR